MARPQKSGLEYFPLNTDIDQDDKIQLIEAKFGIVGFSIVIKMLMKIYNEGYYYVWSEKEQLLFSRKVNVDINELNEVINECLKWDLFDSDIYEQYKILTSRGIQKRYFEATSRRKQVEVIEEYRLIDLENYSNIVYVNINPVNVDSNPSPQEVNADISTQSKVKESKVKESKVNIYSPDFEKFWDSYPKKVGKKRALACWHTRIRNKADPEQMIQAAINYARSCFDEKKEDKYIMHPSTFLSDKEDYKDWVKVKEAEDDVFRPYTGEELPQPQPYRG